MPRGVDQRQLLLRSDNLNDLTFLVVILLSTLIVLLELRCRCRRDPLNQFTFHVVGLRNTIHISLLGVKPESAATREELDLFQYGVIHEWRAREQTPMRQSLLGSPQHSVQLQMPQLLMQQYGVGIGPPPGPQSQSTSLPTMGLAVAIPAKAARATAMKSLKNILIDFEMRGRW